jgi:hypothetical protein
MQLEGADKSSSAPMARSIFASGLQTPSLLRIWMKMLEQSDATEPRGVEALVRSYHMITTPGQGLPGSAMASEDKNVQSLVWDLQGPFAKRAHSSVARTVVSISTD